MDELVRTSRYNIFLGQSFEPVRSRLQNPARTHPVWTVAILDSAQALALQHRRHREERGENADDRGHGNESRDNRLALRRRETDEQVFNLNENLVHYCLCHGGCCGTWPGPRDGRTPRIAFETSQRKKLEIG